MNTNKRWQIYTEAMAAILIFLFVYTALSKITEPLIFKKALAQAPLLAPFAGLLTFGIPLVEFGLATLLLIPRTRQQGLVLSFLLLLLFTVYVGLMLLLSNDLPCACGGVLKYMGWQEHFLFNAGCTLAAWTGWKAAQKANRTPSKFLFE